MPLLEHRTSQLCQEFAFWASSPPRDFGGIYEMRTYDLVPGSLLEWEHEWRRGLEARSHFVQPVGAWFSQVGRLHQVHHVWNYASMEQRDKQRAEAWKIDGWNDTVVKTVKLSTKMEASIMHPLDFSPLK
ncbi:nipsnap family protein [Atractiella rhizophila]|nr:nipsnap family protein [Atractiella rhizophila]